MNGVDYTKKLANEREYFQDAIKKDRDMSEKRIAENEKRHDEIQKRQSDTFIEDKNEIEKHYQGHLENVRNKTQAAIEDQNYKSRKELESQRESFAREAQVKSQDFNDRLNDIRSSYQKSFDSEKKNHQSLQEHDKNRYNRNVADITKDTDTKLKDYQDRLHGAGSDLKDQYKREREQLVRANEDHLQNVYKDENEKRTDLKERLASDVKKSKEIHESEIAHTKKHSKDRLDNMQKHYEDRYQTMTKDYSQRNDNLVESTRREAVKANQENQQKLMDTRRDFNKQMQLVEMDKRRRDNGDGEFSEVSKRQNGLNDKIVYEDKMNHLKTELVEAQRGFNARRSKDQDNFNQDLKTESSEATARLERKMNEMNADKLVTVSKERESAQKKVENREYQNRIDKASYERQLMVERNNANQRVDKLKENFNKSMTALEERGQANIEAVTKSANTDKAEFTKQMYENRNNEVFEMKREFTKIMDSTVQDYEQRLSHYQRENDTLKLAMSQKVANIVDQTDKQMETQRKWFEDKRVADQRANQLLMDQREHALKTATNQMNLSYQKKLDEMQVSNDRKLKLITNDYENKLKELTSSKARDIAQKDSTHQGELERLKQTYEDEKARVVTQYENQINAMKLAHSEQVDSLKEFKRLS